MALTYESKILTTTTDIDAWLNSRKPVGILGYAVCKDPFRIASNLVYITIAYYNYSGTE